MKNKTVGCYKKAVSNATAQFLFLRTTVCVCASTCNFGVIVITAVMFRNNNLCAPEMSFGDRSEEPHAYVAYVDGEKEVIPLSFLKKFPVDWRKGWDRKYLYQVFWSPKAEDSPRKALQRMPEIPDCEVGTATNNRAGWYRATVLLVADSYDAVTDSLDRKRCPASNMLGTYTSFDEPRKSKQSKSEMAKNNDSNQKNKKPKKNKKPAADKIADPFECSGSSEAEHSKMKSKEEDDEKRKENKGGTADNSCDFNNGGNQKTGTDSSAGGTDSSSEGSEEEKDKESHQKTAETSSDSLKSSCRDSNSFSSSMKRVKRKMSFSHSDEELGRESSSTFPTKELDSEVHQSDGGKKRKLVQRVSSLKSKIYNADTTDSEFEIDGKKYACDPDYTPRKNEELKSLIKIKDVTIQKLQVLNMRHQENLFKYEEKISKLEKEKSELQQQVDRLQAKLKSVSQRKENISVPQHKESIPVSQRKENIPASQHTEKISVSQTKNTSVSQNKKNMSTSQHKEKMSSQNPVSSPRSSPTASGPRAEDFCEPLYSGGSEDEEMEESKPLLDGVSADLKIWSLIRSIKSGEKGDLRFVKDLAVVGFGPETLAASSIKGTKRGHAKDVQSRPPLNAGMLKKIFNCLVKRVQKELGGDEKDLVNSHYRLTTARFHSALRQVQKRVRGEGYGVKEKTDEVTIDLLSDR